MKRSGTVIGVITATITAGAMWLGPAASAAPQATTTAAATCTPVTGNPFCPLPPGTCTNPVVCPLPPGTGNGENPPPPGTTAVEQELAALAQRYPALSPLISRIENLITTIGNSGGSGTGRIR